MCALALLKEIRLDIVNRGDTAAFRTKDTSIIREILRPQNSCVQRQSLAEATLEAGAATQAHYHPATEEIYYILEGHGLLAIEQEARGVGPGDAIPIPPGCRHQIKNSGRQDLVFLCCCTPAYSDDDTVICASLILQQAEPCR